MEKRKIKREDEKRLVIISFHRALSIDILDKDSFNEINLMFRYEDLPRELQDRLFVIENGFIVLKNFDDDEVFNEIISFGISNKDKSLI